MLSSTTRPAPAGSAERILAQVASLLLPGAGGVDRPAGPEHAAWLVTRARTDQLLGPLLAAIEGGLLELDETLIEQVVQEQEQALQWCLHLEQRMLDVGDWAAEAGLDLLVVKGPAVAHLDEPDPSWRTFADLDLLVPSDQLDGTVAVLSRHGAARRVPELRAGFDRRFEKSVGLMCADGVELDLHRTLAMGALGLRIPLDELFRAPDRFEVGGQVFRTLRLEHRALHAAYHAVLGAPEPPLRTLRDLAGYLSRPELGPGVVAAEARRWRGETVLAEAVRAMASALLFEVPPAWQEWMAGVRVDERDVALARRSRVEGVWPFDRELARELGWRDRAVLAWGVAFPSPESLADRGLTRWGRIRTGVVRVARHMARGRGR